MLQQMYSSLSESNVVLQQNMLEWKQQRVISGAVLFACDTAALHHVVVYVCSLISVVTSRMMCECMMESLVSSSDSKTIQPTEL